MLRNKENRYICGFWVLGILGFLFCFQVLPFVFCAELANQEDLVYNENNKRDPFIPLVTADGRLLKLDKEDGLTGLSVEGLIYDQQGLSYALVDGRVVKVGDSLGEYQVMRIEKDKIIFVKNGEPIEVELKKEE
jgi:hypothetical protein